MSEPLKPLLSWRLKLILLVGAVAFGGVFLFARHVDQIDDTFGALPMALGIKARGANIDRYFEGKREMSKPTADHKGTGQAPPTLSPRHTETAFFAYG